MPAKVLVAYATRRGSTKEIAEAIAWVIAQRGSKVDVLPVQEITDITRYEAIVLGSPIYQAEWMTEAVDFIRRHQLALSAKPVALFCTSMTMHDDTQRARLTILGHLNPILDLLPQVKDEDIGLFGGVYDLHDWTIISRWWLKARGRFPEGDFRHWDAVCDWADYIARRVINVRETA